MPNRHGFRRAALVMLAVTLCSAKMLPQGTKARTLTPGSARQVNRDTVSKSQPGAPAAVVIQLPASIASHLDSLLIAATNGLKAQKPPEKHGWLDALRIVLEIVTGLLVIATGLFALTKDWKKFRVAAAATVVTPVLGGAALLALVVGVPVALALIGVSTFLLAGAAWGFLILALHEYASMRKTNESRGSAEPSVNKPRPMSPST